MEPYKYTYKYRLEDCDGEALIDRAVAINSDVPLTRIPCVGLSLHTATEVAEAAAWPALVYRSDDTRKLSFGKTITNIGKNIHSTICRMFTDRHLDDDIFIEVLNTPVGIKVDDDGVMLSFMHIVRLNDSALARKNNATEGGDDGHQDEV